MMDMDILYRSIERELLNKIQNGLNPGRLIDSIKEYISRMATVWRNLGLSEEQRQPRGDRCEQHLISHLTKECTKLVSAIAEAEEMEQKIIADVADYRVELDNLCNEMKRSCEIVRVLC